MSKPDFEWDEEKDLENQQKHGVTFLETQHAFLDQNRVIAEDPIIVKKSSAFTASDKTRIKMEF